jgi:hypothetical protein
MIVNPGSEQEQQVRVVEGNLHIGVREQARPLRVVCLGREPIIDHDPLQVHDDWLERNRHVWLPAFDREGLKALVVNRYAWGMNTGAAFLDIEAGVIYCWKCRNFDHPVGLALRSREDRIEIFLDNNGVTRRNVWVDPERQLPCLENFYHDSGWKDLRMMEEFDNLLTWLQFNRKRGMISEPVNMIILPIARTNFWTWSRPGTTKVLSPMGGKLSQPRWRTSAGEASHGAMTR